MKDFQMLTLCFTFFIALDKIKSLALWKGQTIPGLDSHSVMGMCVPSQVLLATFPTQIRQQPHSNVESCKADQ